MMKRLSNFCRTAVLMACLGLVPGGALLAAAPLPPPCDPDTLPPRLYLTDVLGNLLADTDAGTTLGNLADLGVVMLDQVNCAANRSQYYVYGFVGCTGRLTGAQALTATAHTTANNTWIGPPVTPGTTATLTPLDPGVYRLEINPVPGRSVVNLTGLAPNGLTASLRLIFAAPGNLLPSLRIEVDTVLTIPICATEVEMYMLVFIEPTCASNEFSSNNLEVTINGVMHPATFQGYRFKEYQVTFSAAGSYEVIARYIDAAGNVVTAQQTIEVIHSTVDEPPRLSVYGNDETVACGPCKSMSLSLVISDDCAPIDVGALSFQSAGSGLVPLFPFFDYLSPYEVYTLVFGCVYLGQWSPTLTYQNEVFTINLSVLDGTNDPPLVELPDSLAVANLGCAPATQLCFPLEITDYCSGEGEVDWDSVSFSLNGAELTPQFGSFTNTGRQVCVDLPTPSDGDTLRVAYTGENGLVGQASRELRVTEYVQPPLLQLCAPSTVTAAPAGCAAGRSLVTFEVLAVDLCSPTTVPQVEVTALDGTAFTMLPRLAAHTYAFVAEPGAYQVRVRASSAAGQVSADSLVLEVLPPTDPGLGFDAVCRDTVRLDLGVDCPASLTPELALSGQLGCVPLRLMVEDTNPQNGEQVDGCGVFTFWVEDNPDTLRGFVGALTPARWTACADAPVANLQFTDQLLQLTAAPSATATDALGGYASLVWPFAGELSVDYAIQSSAGDAAEILLLDAAGDTIAQVGPTLGTDTGTFTHPVAAGWVLLVRLRAQAGAASGLSLSNLVFVPNVLPGGFACTGILVVTDSSQPGITAAGGNFCTTTPTVCTAPVTLEAVVTDGCASLADLTVRAWLDTFAVDANGDGGISPGEFVADAEVTTTALVPLGNGAYRLAGQYLPGLHAFRLTATDPCGNQTEEVLTFTVTDCVAPQPSCLNAQVTLEPVDADGDGFPDLGEGRVTLLARNLALDPGADCSGSVQLAVYAQPLPAGMAPSAADSVLTLSCEDAPATTLYLYALDAPGNYSVCQVEITLLDQVCAEPTITGLIRTETLEPVANVEVALASQLTTTDAGGLYQFAWGSAGVGSAIVPSKNTNHLGVTTVDMLRVMRHILNQVPITSPYQLIAADVNNSGSITAADVLEMRQLLLGLRTSFTNNGFWRFFQSTYSFPNPANPWEEDLTPYEQHVFDGVGTNYHFVAVPIGDLNTTAQTNPLLPTDSRNVREVFSFEVSNQLLRAGQTYQIDFYAHQLADINGYQGTLELRGAELVDVVYGLATARHFGLHRADEGVITTSWHWENSPPLAHERLFSLVIRAAVAAPLSEVLGISSRYTLAEAYDLADRAMDVAIAYTSETWSEVGFAVYPLQPNPWRETTQLGFTLPQDEQVHLTVSDLTGRTLTVWQFAGQAGYNQVSLDRTQCHNATGLLYFTLTAGAYSATQKMVVLE